MGEPALLGVLLDVVHEARAVPSDLLVGVDRTERNLRKALHGVGAEAKAAHHLLFLEKDHGVVLAVEEEADDVLAGHLGQLGREDVLGACQPHVRAVRTLVRDHLIRQRPLLLLAVRQLIPRHVKLASRRRRCRLPRRRRARSCGRR